MAKEQLTFKVLALRVAEVEGKKQETNIAQINEILKIALQILAWSMHHDPYGTMAFFKRYRDMFIK